MSSYMTNEEFLKLLEDANRESINKTAQRMAVSDSPGIDPEEFGRKAAQAFMEEISKHADNVNPIVTTDTGSSAPEPNPAVGGPSATQSEETLSDLLNAVTGASAQTGESTQVGGSAKINSPSVDVDKVIQETAQKILSENIVNDPESAAVIAEALVGAPATMEKMAEDYENLGRLYARIILDRLLG